MPVLYRVAAGPGRTHWQIAATHLMIMAYGPAQCRVEGCWRDVRGETNRWLDARGLRDVQFATRGEALRCVWAQMQLSAPPRRVEGQVRLLPDGHRWRSADGHWAVQRTDTGTLLAVACSDAAVSAGFMGAVTCVRNATLAEMSRRLYFTGRAWGLYA